MQRRREGQGERSERDDGPERERQAMPASRRILSAGADGRRRQQHEARGQHGDLPHPVDPRGGGERGAGGRDPGELCAGDASGTAGRDAPDPEDEPDHRQGEDRKEEARDFLGE